MTGYELKPGMLIAGYGLFVERSGFEICYIDESDPYYGKIYQAVWDFPNTEFKELYQRGSEPYIAVVKSMIASRKEAADHANSDINWMETLL